MLIDVPTKEDLDPPPATREGGCLGIVIAFAVGLILGGVAIGFLWSFRENLLAEQQQQKAEKIAKAQVEAGKSGERLEMMYLDNVDPWVIRGFASRGKFRSVSSIYCYGAVGLCDLAHFREAESIDIGRIQLVDCGPHDLSDWKSLRGLTVSIDSRALKALQGIETLPQLGFLSIHLPLGSPAEIEPLFEILPLSRSLKNVRISGLEAAQLEKLRAAVKGIEFEEGTPIGEW